VQHLPAKKSTSHLTNIVKLFC